MADAFQYHVKGALYPDDASYVERAADKDLWANLQQGVYSYVLAPRQMGKSSLLARTVERLRSHHPDVDAEGPRFHVATANIQSMGDDVEEAKWYEGIVDQLVTTAELNEGFQMPFDWTEWWDSQTGPLSQRLITFVREAFLKPNEYHWVIAVDEIDATINLPFTDSFFTALRTCHDFRPGQPVFRRLTFVLLGVATPDELIANRTRTPFNVGKEVDLAPFHREEAEPLAAGFPLNDELKQKALDCVISWTGGQPHLTQDACDALARQWREKRPVSPSDVEADVDDLMEHRYVDYQTRPKNVHLDYIEHKRLLGYPNRTSLLRAYKQTLSDEGLADDRESGIVAELKISGLARKSEDGRLRVANRIYAEVFNRDWIRANTPRNTTRRVAVTAVVLLALLPGLWYEFIYPRQFISYLQTTEEMAEQGRVLSKDYALAEAYYHNLKEVPFRKQQAESLWAEFNKRRIEDAIQQNQLTYRQASPDVQDKLEEAVYAGYNTLSELSDAGKTIAERLLSRFHRERLVLAMKLDAEAYESVQTRTEEVPDARAIQQQQFAFQEVSTFEKHLDDKIRAENRPEFRKMVSDFYRLRAERSEFAEKQGRSILWRLKQLAVRDDPHARRQLGMLVGTSLNRLIRGWGDFDKGKRQYQSNGDGYFGRMPLDTEARYFSDGETVLIVSRTGLMQIYADPTQDPVYTYEHEGPIAGYFLSEDEQRLVSWSEDGIVYIWQVGETVPLRVIDVFEDQFPKVSYRLDDGAPRRPQSRLTGLACSRNAETFMTRDDSSKLRWWWFHPDGPVSIYQSEGGRIQPPQFSSDGQRILTWNLSDQFTVYSEGSEPKTVPDPQGVKFAQLSPDGRKVVTLHLDQTNAGEPDQIKIWTVGSDDPPHLLSAPEYVQGVTFSPDNQHLLSWNRDYTATLWSLENDTPTRTLRHRSMILGADFSPDGRWAFAWWEGGQLQVASTKNETPPIEIQSGSTRIERIEFLDGVRQLFIHAENGDCELWSLDRTEPVAIFRAPGRVVDVSGDRRRMLTTSGEVVQYWEQSSRRPRLESPDPNRVRLLQLDPQRKYILTLGKDQNTVLMWSLEQNKQIQRFDQGDHVSGARFKPDSARVMTWGRPNRWVHTVKIWSVESGENLESRQLNLLHHYLQYGRVADRTNRLEGMVFSREGPYAVVSNGRLGTTLWELDVPEHPDVTWELGDVNIQFSSDGRYFVTGDSPYFVKGNREKKLKLWSFDRAEPVRTEDVKNAVDGFAFSPDSRHLLFWLGDGSLLFWSIENPEPPSLISEESTTRWARFNADGTQFLSYGQDGTIEVWSTDPLKRLDKVRHYGPVDHAWFAPDSQRIFAWNSSWMHSTIISGRQGQAEPASGHQSRRFPASFLTYPLLDADGHEFSVQADLDDFPNDISRLVAAGFRIAEDRPVSERLDVVSLTSWQEKLGLKINDLGEVVPLRPLTNSRPPPGGLAAKPTMIGD